MNTHPETPPPLGPFAQFCAEWVEQIRTETLPAWQRVAVDARDALGDARAVLRLPA